MKVCLISSEYPPETGFGGIGTYTYNLAHGLVKAENEVTVIAKALIKERVYLDKGVKVYTVYDNRLRVRGLARVLNFLTGKGFSNYRHSLSVFKKIEEIIKKEGKFDIIEGPLWDGECFAYSKKINVPLVVRLQTPIFKLQEILNQPRNIALEFIEKKSLEKACQVISISQNVSDLISKKYKISKNKIIVSPLGIEFPNIKKPAFNKNSFKLLFVGRLEKRKGVGELIKSIPGILEANKNISIDMVGKDCFQAPGNNSYVKYFNEVVPGKFKKRVKFHGFVSLKKLKSFYRNCDLFIAPSRYESFGLVYLEAMAYGKPVIGTRAGGIVEVIKDNRVGLLIDVNNPGQITNSVIKVLSDEKLRRKMGLNAFNYVRKNFTVKKMTENTLKIYNKAILNFYG